MSRTEEQKLLSEPVIVVLGGKDYPINPLVLKEAAPWRKKLIELFAKSQVNVANITTDDPDAFNGALADLFLNNPADLMGLFFEYAKLDKDEIEGLANTREIMAALEEVVALEAPFFVSAARMMAKVQETV